MLTFLCLSMSAVAIIIIFISYGLIQIDDYDLQFKLVIGLLALLVFLLIVTLSVWSIGFFRNLMGFLILIFLAWLCLWFFSGGGAEVPGGSQESGKFSSLDIGYRVQDVSTRVDGISGSYASSEVAGMKDVDRLKNLYPNRTYRLISINTKTQRLISVLYTR